MDNPMINGPYFSYTIDNSLDAKCKAPTWQRTTGIETELCRILNESRDKTIMHTDVRRLTRWPKEDVKLWFSMLHSRGVLVCFSKYHANRYCLAHDFPADRDSLLELIPLVGSTILPEKEPSWREKKVNHQVSKSAYKVTAGDKKSHQTTHVNPTVDYVYPGYA